MQSELGKFNIVLMGAGHTNAHILRMWRMKPIPNAQLICVSNYPIATYSGMMPGVLAGDYSLERMQIDLVRLCASVGARLIVDQVNGVDAAARTLSFAGRPALPFDALSVGVGSAPNMEAVDDSTNVTPIKPMQTFLARLEASVRSSAPGDRPLTVAVVGGGLGGAEISLCLSKRLPEWIGNQPFRISMVTSGQVGAGLGAMASRVLQREMSTKGVEILSGRRVERVEKGQLVYDNGERGTFDVILWATSAVAPNVLSLFDLPKDDRGFLRVDRTLRTVAPDVPIFAVGDSGTIDGESLPKAGVYAVRQGPVLFHNLSRQLNRQPLRQYKPQRKFLKLINLGDGRAIGEYGPLSLCNRFMWTLKDRIDGRFMDKYQDYRPPMMQMRSDSEQDEMRCAGCGGKVGPSVLKNALERLALKDDAKTSLGLEAPDDVAFVELPGDGPVAATVDFFAAPLNDPYLVGRIAALNAASDMFASGAQASAALTIATAPLGHPRAQEQVMFEAMSGSAEEFAKTGASLVGGHTTEGPQLLLGFAMLGRTRKNEKPILKSGVQVDDRLVLTKSLGAGVLLAAHMRAACRAEWWERLLDNMLASNQPSAELLRSLGATALTDVTGFGLAGHLLEMLNASEVSAEIELDRIPVLPGAIELVEQGVASTLSPANRAAETQIAIAESLRVDPRYKLLFDPQTCGGLLASVAPGDAEEVVGQLQAAGIEAAIIGRATTVGEGLVSLRVSKKA